MNTCYVKFCFIHYGYIATVKFCAGRFSRAVSSQRSFNYIFTTRFASRNGHSKQYVLFVWHESAELIKHWQHKETVQRADTRPFVLEHVKPYTASKPQSHAGRCLWFLVDRSLLVPRRVNFQSHNLVTDTSPKPRYGLITFTDHYAPTTNYTLHNILFTLVYIAKCLSVDRDPLVD